VRRIVVRYHKKRKMLFFWIWLRPRYKIAEFFTIAPVITSTVDGLPPKSRRSVVSILRVRYKYYKKQSFWFVLEPSTR